MKKWISILTGLFIGLSVMGQTYLAHQNSYRSAYLPFESGMVSALEVYDNFVFISDMDTIRMLDLNAGTMLKKYGKPADDTVSVSASFLTVSPDGTSIWAGYTNYTDADHRIYRIDLASGAWAMQARFPRNFNLVFWNDIILVSGIGSTSWEDPNGIFLLDTSGQDQHRMLIETGGYSTGIAKDSDGDLYYGTSFMMDPNGLYRWDSAQLAGILNPGVQDTLHIRDAEKLSDLPAGAYDCDVDMAGNLVLTMNQIGGKNVLARWNGTGGEGIHLDTLAYTTDKWLALLKTIGNVTHPEIGNSILTFSFGESLVDIHAADYPPYVAHPLPDLNEQEIDLSDPIDLSFLFSDPDDPDTMIVLEVLYDEFPFEMHIEDNKLYIQILYLVKGAAEFMETEVVIRGVSAGLAVTDTFMVAIDYVGGIGDHDQSHLDVYPNPSEGIYRVKGAEPGVASVAVFTLTGTEIFRRAIQVQDEPVDITGLPDGTYIIRITGERGSSSTLIQKQ